MKTILSNIFLGATALCGILAFSAPAMAGTYRTITIDGDFSDWDGVPILTTDTIGGSSPFGFTALYAANDDDYLYIRVVFNASYDVNTLNGGPSIYVSLDNDNNASTGWDIFGYGVLGSEAGWQNDFPFAQSNASFNSGSLTDGAIGIAPYFSNTTEQEMRISRSAVFNSDSMTIFPNDTFALGVYADASNSPLVGKGVYTFASVPEPASGAFVLGALCLTWIAIRRRRR